MKKILMLSICIMLLVGCGKVNSDPEQTENSEETYEDAYNRIGEQDTVMDIQLNEVVHVGADIETAYDAYKDGVGIYNFRKVSREQVMVSDDSNIIQNVKDYYGYEILNGYHSRLI